MNTDQAHRMANLYDACWELVKEAPTGEGNLTVATRARFVACWGLAANAQDDETLVHWARNFLTHNARPNV
jgi:hypothetical protein